MVASGGGSGDLSGAVLSEHDRHLMIVDHPPVGISDAAGAGGPRAPADAGDPAADDPYHSSEGSG